MGVGIRGPTAKLEVWEKNTAEGNHYLLELQRHTGSGERFARGTGLLYSDANSIQAGIVAERPKPAVNYRSDLTFLVNRNRPGYEPDHALLERMRITSRGRVGIGTQSPSKRLSVNDAVKAKEVIVTETGWADFVFEEGYDLPSLEEVERHIEREGRLPGMPSAEEVTREGGQLGETNRKLLQKVEELTLYAIDRNESAREQQAEIDRLREAKRVLREELDVLARRVEVLEQ